MSDSMSVTDICEDILTKRGKGNNYNYTKFHDYFSQYNKDALISLIFHGYITKRIDPNTLIVRRYCNKKGFPPYPSELECNNPTPVSPYYSGTVTINTSHINITLDGVPIASSLNLPKDIRESVVASINYDHTAKTKPATTDMSDKISKRACNTELESDIDCLTAPYTLDEAVSIYDDYGSIEGTVHITNEEFYDCISLELCHLLLNKLIDVDADTLDDEFDMEFKGFDEDGIYITVTTNSPPVS